MIGVISLLITGLVVVAVLVSIRMITDSNMEIAKYSMNANGVKQNVTTSENSVIYHVTRENIEAWIVQDFNTGLQVSKVLADGKATCYVTVLNRSEATDPSSIPTTAPDTTKSQPKSAVYKVSPDMIPDITFLGKKGSALCANIPTYHAVPDCENAANKDHSLPGGNSSSVDQRQKRTPAYCATLGGYQCACGCCGYLCGIFTSNYVYCYYSAGYYNCVFQMRYIYARGSLAAYGCWFGGRYYYPY